MADSWTSKLMFTLRHPLRAAGYQLLKLPFLRIIRHTKGSMAPVTFGMWFLQRVAGFNRSAYWPVHFTSKIARPDRILVGHESYPGYMPGCYIQGVGVVRIGNHVSVAPNVGIVGGNHRLHDARDYDTSKSVVIGDYCWLGMGSIILPGVELGPYTIVAAGAVVTHKFPEGYQILGGNPAKMIRKLDPAECVHYDTDKSYRGYIRSSQFEAYRQKFLHPDLNC